MKRTITLILFAIIFITGCATLKTEPTKCCEHKEDTKIEKQKLRVSDPNAKPAIELKN